ncbi:MAG: hypothetical protein FWF01_04480, partial [Alphaproteobacteria bacterium]|nr:hypothetical protein [Alphaproteobacteria bacterium]
TYKISLCKDQPDFVKLSPHQTTLKPRQTQAIKVQRKPMPEEAGDGEYVVRLFVQETAETAGSPGQGQGSSKILRGVSIPIIIRKGSLDSSAEIRNVSLDKDSLRFNLHRSGSKSLFVNLVVMDGHKEIGRLGNVRVFLDRDMRSVSVPLARMPSGSTVTILVKDAADNSEVVRQTAGL